MGARHVSSHRTCTRPMEPLVSTGTAGRTAPPRPRVVLVASPGAGHLIPMAEIARRLVAHHGLAATLVTFADISARPDAHSSVFSSIRDAGVATAVLPAVPLDVLPPDQWLDRQTTGSVVYVSFGSAGSLSVEQTAELAAGLEDSGHRFLWVVRMPSLDGINFAMFIGHMSDKDDPLAWLPEGFVERTSGRGLAVAAWAPQARVLSHPATAALVSHCGWNSTLERVASGMPMVAWPLYAEQRMERRGPVGERGRGAAAARSAGGRADRAGGDPGGRAGGDGWGGERGALCASGDGYVSTFERYLVL
ncbi:hypothetical protein C2845_PM12G07960 [Panicum miliaceum]|uniref:UDP-glycosyltransferases domain-containing protein n=1 Tax=Panicum miliaceum TaxID=4540 RepID=A0A3L6QLK5_PANMI|nr:hypothetical protein C2845_PM12G07960 [Panicum miliaceum]